MENGSISRSKYYKSVSKYSVVACPDKEHVPYIKSVTLRIEEVLRKEFNIEAKILEDAIKPQESNLQTISNLLKDCILGIVILDGLRPNVVWEYGVLYGLEKPIIVLKDRNAEINIKSLLDNTSNSKLEKYHISNPKLDIDKHFSNIKDLHYIEYDWKEPKELEDVLIREIKKIEDKIVSEINRSMTPENIRNLDIETYNEFQKEFSKLAKDIVKFTRPTVESINELHNKLTTLAKKRKINLPSEYYFSVGNIYFDLSEYEKAEKEFREAIKISPNYAEAHNRL